MHKSTGFSLGLLAALALPVFAQDRDRGRDDWNVADIMRSSDDNGDGTIEQNELGRTSGYYVRLAAQRIGLDPNGTLPADKIRGALEAMKAEGGGSSGNSGSGSGNNNSPVKSASPPGAPQGFGGAVAAGPAKVPGFDVPLSVNAGAPLEKQFDARVIEYVSDMIKERDANKNGVLEKNEWTGRWSTPPEESDLNRDNILSKEELCVRIAKRFNIAPGGSGGAPASFGGGSGSPGSSGSGSGDASKLRGYAESLIKQYDESKNGMLEKDEAKNLRSEHQLSDANKDGVITIDELAAHLQAYSAGNSPSSGSGAGSSGPGGPPGSPSSSGSRWGDRGSFGSRGPSSSDKDKAAQAKKSYRFLTPTERLPKGMPDWFLRGDADGDGQVSMVEYASSWSEQVAAEFLKFDLDGDGMITPEECQKAEKEKSARK